MTDFAITVRCIVVYQKKVLLLQKDSDSKLPNKFEFPGGKVEDQMAKSSDATLAIWAQKELREETSLDVTVEKAKKLHFSKRYAFSLESQYFERDVFYFYIPLQENSDTTVKVNETKKNNGGDEDNHSGYIWVTLKKLQKLSIENKISPNSHIPNKVLVKIFK